MSETGETIYMRCAECGATVRVFARLDPDKVLRWYPLGHKSRDMGSRSWCLKGPKVPAVSKEEHE